MFCSLSKEDHYVPAQQLGTERSKTQTNKGRPGRWSIAMRQNRFAVAI